MVASRRLRRGPRVLQFMFMLALLESQCIAPLLPHKVVTGLRSVLVDVRRSSAFYDRSFLFSFLRMKPQDYPFPRGASDFAMPLPPAALWRSQVDHFCIFRNLHEALPPKCDDGRVVPVRLLALPLRLRSQPNKPTKVGGALFAQQINRPLRCPCLAGVCLLHKTYFICTGTKVPTDFSFSRL